MIDLGAENGGAAPIDDEGAGLRHGPRGVSRACCRACIRARLRYGQPTQYEPASELLHISIARCGMSSERDFFIDNLLVRIQTGREESHELAVDPASNRKLSRPSCAPCLVRL